ncbi:restriction endonuclease [Streptomyces sp. NBC_00140]|uniref:restriction endonuclease n=1 Tax=Streptomyces sp. NBC_00140 TaxID=2975664 RepID=UPI0022591608|nr:restriction endonuclease [Streptomyces sp. NBC_00140]MCX5328152.1 restriction endonuclease [Streptomyces sp. NBC_00140]
MELEELLRVMDRSAANLGKLDSVWQRAQTFIPSGPSRGSHPEYDDLRRAWVDLLPGLPPIDGWTISDELPDIDAMGQSFIDYFEISESPDAVHAAGEKPGADLSEYRYRLNRARRRAARGRLQQLVSAVDTALPLAVQETARDSEATLVNEQTKQIAAAVGEIERLLGDTTERTGRWADLHRHMRFSQGQDWHDVLELDWPTVRADIEAGALGDSDPLSIPDIDLGHAASGQLTGAATLALPWERLDDDGFERLLYDLLRSIPEHENVQWLMRTRAPDRGRDLSLDRVLRDGTGGVRTERVIVQAKHWLSRSVNAAAVSETTTAGKLWGPPLVRGIVIATSGRFTADAVSWVERHNAEGITPHIDLWPESRLETLLAQKPHIAAAHGLR